MRGPAILFVLGACAQLGGCAQLFGLDETSKTAMPIDARPTDAPNDIGVDAPRACVGGDARIKDPTTGSCFVLFLTPASREDARAMCLTLGADTQLARIESEAENQTVLGLIGQTSAFLGANDAIAEGTFVWQDGTSMTFSKWNTGEPNNGLGMLEEDCAMIHGSLGGLWDDRPCAPPPIELGMAAFVCEHD